MSKYLVTGGAGFIGTNIIKRLLADGHGVTVVDNYAGGKFPERLQAGAEYIEADIRDLENFKKICLAGGFDGIFHLAALPRVPFSVEFPLESHEINIDGTLKVLLAARDAKIKRVVFSSSSSVYGEQEHYPVSEDLVALPISPYALHKFVGEHYCRLFAELYGLETVCLRYFNVYGSYFDPNGAYALAVGKFINQKKHGLPLTICGDGEYYRDYVHARDVASANLLAMTSAVVGQGEIFNIGNGHAYSVNQLAEIIGGATVFIPPRLGDIRRTEADNTKARKLLGWSPTLTLEEGIAELKKEWGL